MSLVTPPHHYFFNTAAAAKSLQSCLTLCDPTDGSPPGSPVPGILKARTLEWVVISFSNVRKWKVKVKSLSRVQLVAPGSSVHGILQARVLLLKKHHKPELERWFIRDSGANQR